MGTAFTGLADDASALYFNPAGIAFLPGMQFQMDNILVNGFFRFVPAATPPGTIVPETGFNGLNGLKYQPLGSLFYSQQISERWTMGLGVFAAFGLSGNFTNFKDSDPEETKFVGRFAGTRDRMENVWLQPTLAYRMTPNSSFAIGPSLVYNHAILERSFLNPLDDGLDFGRLAADLIFPGQDKEQAAQSIARMLPEGRARISGTSKSPGIVIAYLYKHPQGKFGFGISARNAVVHHFNGQMGFGFTEGSTLEQVVGRGTFTEAFPSQPIKFSLTTPGTLATGISFNPFGRSIMAFDFRVQDYRRFKDVPVNFSKTAADDPAIGTPAEQRLSFDFRNSYNVAVGLEIPLGSKAAIRTGYLYDRTPVKDASVGPLFPDSSRHKITAGFSKVMGGKEITMYYDFTQFVNRTTDVPENAKQWTNGQYRNYAQILGMSFRFGDGLIP